MHLETIKFPTPRLHLQNLVGLVSVFVISVCKTEVSGNVCPYEIPPLKYEFRIRVANPLCIWANFSVLCGWQLNSSIPLGHFVSVPILLAPNFHAPDLLSRSMTHDHLRSNAWWLNWKFGSSIQEKHDRLDKIGGTFLVQMNWKSMTFLEWFYFGN